MRKATKWGSVLMAAMLTVNLVSPCTVQTVKAEGQETYEIYPNPHKIEYTGGNVEVPQTVKAVYSESVDDTVENYLSETLADTTGSSIGESDFTVSVEITGDEDASRNTEVETENLFEKNDAYVLEVSDGEINITGNDNDAVFSGISTLKIMLEQSEDNTVLKTKVEDYADVQYRGVVEGYYGIPWSNENIISYMEWGSKFKMNTFIYAPKDDPYHNSKWREPYPDEELDKMQELIEAGTRTKVRFVYAIHPFMSNGINKEKFEEEIKHITDKFESLYDLGVRQFALLADDASSETALQVKTINALTDWLDSKEGTYPLIFCPQSYSGTPNASYFAQFKEGTTITIGGQQQTVPAVAEDVEIMYTGSAIIGNVEEQVADRFAEVSGRNPYFWLNWPVNDYTDSTLFIGKAEMLKSRATNLNGLVANPMCEAQLSKIGLFQVADYAWNIGAFDVDSSWQASFKNVDADAADALAVVAKHMSYPRDGVYHQTGLAWEESEDLAPLITELEEKIEAGESISATAETLKAELEKILAASEEIMEKSHNQNLKDEFEPYKESMDATLNAGITGLEALIAYEKEDYDTTWELYSKISTYIDASNAVTKPGYKPEGNVQLEVKPGTKRLRPLAAYLNKTVADLMNEILGLGGETARGNAYYHFTDWKNPSADNINKYLDDSESTMMSLQGVGQMQKVGDYYGVDLGEVKNLQNVRILQGNSDTDHDIFHYCVLETSKDGEQWTVIKDYQESAAPNTISVDTNVAARYVRLRLTTQGYNGKQDYWLGVRDFKVTINEGVSLFTDVEDTTAMSVTSEEGKAEFEANSMNLAKGQYAGIDLGAIKKVHVETEGIAEGLTVQCSDNAKVWETLEESSLETRYIRILNHTDDTKDDITAAIHVQIDEIKPVSVSFGAVHGEEDGYNASVMDNPAQKLLQVTGLEDKEHTLTIISKGEKGQDKVSVDRFEVTKAGETTQVNITKETEGLTLSVKDSSKSWAMYSPKANWLNNDELYLVDTNGTMEYSFEGDGIALFGAKGPTMGELEYFIDGVAYDGTGDAIFDGEDSTQAHYKTDKVAIDFGQEIAVKNLKLKVAEDTYTNHPDWTLGKGKIEVSADGEKWETVRNFNITGNEVSESEDTFDKHEVPFFYMDIDMDKEVRYVRLALEEEKEFAVNELIVNDGEEFPAEKDYALSSSEAETNSNPLKNLTDGKLDTIYTVPAKEDGHLNMKLSDKDQVSKITVIQDAQTLSSAKAEILSHGKWVEIGKLDKAINVFDVSSYPNVTELKISYEAGNSFRLMEITYKTDADLKPVVPEVDKSALEKALAEAAKKEEQDYTAESWKDFAAAKAEAETVYNNENASEDEVKAATDKLNAAMAALEEKEPAPETDVSTEVLKYALDLANKADTTGVIGSVVVRFENLKEQAEDLLARVAAGDDSVTQEEIDQTWKDLIKVMQYLSFKQGDKTDLEKVITVASQIDLEKYLEIGQDAYLTALEKANEVLADQDAMQDEVDTTWRALLKAMSDLRLKPNKDALKALIESAEMFSLEGVESADAEMFRAALADARTVYVKEEATAEEVAAAVDTLQAAMDTIESKNAAQSDKVANAAVGDSNKTTEKTTADSASASVKGGETSGQKSAKTGDDMAAAAMLMLMMAAGLAGAVVYKRKIRG